MSSFLQQVIIDIDFFLKDISDIAFKLGLSWSAATTEGVLVYSLNNGFMFDPFLLELGITTKTTKDTLHKKEYASGEFDL